jgi:hypothetical protein
MSQAQKNAQSPNQAPMPTMPRNLKAQLTQNLERYLKSIYHQKAHSMVSFQPH